MIGLAFDRSPAAVACLGAHPDDIEIGAGGSLAHMADRFPDCVFRFAIASGDEVRGAEAEASAAKLLGDRVETVIGTFPDGSVPYADPAGAKEFFRDAFEGFVADVVFCPALIDRHQDHRFVADLAHQLMRDQLILQYEVHKSDGDLARPGIYVPLSADEVATKIAHLEASFTSQHAKPWYDEESLRALLRLRGIECHAPGGYAEAFYADRIVIQ
jgi:LmbE family N-acetylglucosaminyl deacetylase